MTKKGIKILSAAVVAAFVLTSLAACAGAKENVAPEVEGAHDIDCLTDTVVDLLDGVAALDEEDGDITPSMQITVAPQVAVEDGYALFSQAGDYRVTYTVRDSGGAIDSATATVTATARETYVDFVSVGGFRVETGGHVRLTANGMYDGVYRIGAEGCEIAEDLRLTRTYTLDSGYTYSFAYGYECSGSGRAYIAADGAPAAEVWLEEGSGTLNFSYTANGDGDAMDVEIALLFGGVGENIDFVLSSASYSRPQEAGDVDLLRGFSLTGNALGRFDGTEGDVSVAEDGSCATLTVTAASDEAWRGGMFVKTGLTLTAGTEYTVSFTATGEEGLPFEVAVQRDQWNEYKYGTEYFDGRTQTRSVTFTPDASTAGALWLYVQSGNAVNTVTISDIRVTTPSEGVWTQTVGLKDFTCAQAEGYDGELHTEGGNFTYYIGQFSATDWHQQVISPAFYVGGSGSNYVITFRAKATKATQVVFAVPVDGGWDPTLAWERLTITEEEQTFTVPCSKAGGGNMYYLVWQFGSSANLANRDVTIEIGDVRVSYKNSALDD